MKLNMCESTSTDCEMPGVLAEENSSNQDNILTVNIFNNNEDVDRLKARLREIQDAEGEVFDETRIRVGSDQMSVVNNIHSDVEEQLQKSETTSATSESLCISTETLIDNKESITNTSLDVPPDINNMTGDIRTLAETDTVISNSVSSDNVNNLVAVTTTNVSSGLLISPASLSQDVHVQMGNDNKRLSTVLESLDLQLLYIPKTQQLVAQKKKDNQSGSETSNPVIVVKENDIVIENPVSLKGNILRNDSFSSQRSSQRNSPLKMAKSETSSLQSVQILNPGCLDDSSSIGETEYLIRTKEPDQLTCDSSDFVCNFPRINTNESLLRTFTDASSLSSLSTGTDFSISAASLDEGDGTGHCIDTGDAGFMEINLHSRNSFERSKNPSQDSGFEDKSLKPSKRKGLSAIFSRNLFSRKSKDSNHSSDGEENQQGWKLFGKIPPKQGPVKDPVQIEVEYKEKQREDQLAASRAKKEDIEVLSTTALILENRPLNLPMKDPEEIEKHRKEYDAMVAAAKRKEQKELKLKKKQKQQQLRQEEQLMAASRVWTKEILPNWDTMKNSKKARDLWWHGIPTNVRGKVWRLALGNDLNVTQELYEICVGRAEERIKQMDESSVIFGNSETSLALSEPPSSKESSVELIKLDVSRTFPQLCIFQKGGPYHDLLHSLLGAYACYRPDVGYVQGMSFIAAVLLLNMEAADAFICFANLLNRPCQVAFFRVDESLMKVYFQTYEEFFMHNLPNLYSHFKKQNLTPDLYLNDWIFTLYTKSLPLDIACRVWDVFCRDGEEFLFRTALGILQQHEALLMNMDFIHLAQFLTKLPDCDPDFLFHSIDRIQMVIDKRKFTNVLGSKREFRDNS